MKRIFLSPPDVGPDERELVLDAFDSGWLAPLGPHVDAFEAELAAALGSAHAVALSSGTAALHLALLLHGVRPGDEVLVPTLTFVATANAVLHAGAHPVFVDSEPASWNVDPGLVLAELESGRNVGAVVTVDLYGQCADHDPIVDACRKMGVPVVEDAAEALGATYKSRAAGTLGDVGVLSFNGNKLITTSGGGMLLTESEEVAARARHLATQAREPALHYEHVEAGFNYRLSNLLAALGRGQLRHLREKVECRRAIFERYRTALERPGFTFMGEPSWSRSSRWLTVALVDPRITGVSRDEIILRLAAADVEARPTWKPMHRQPLFAGAPFVGGAVAERIFDQGLCLPSGSGMTDDDLDRVISLVDAVLSGPAQPPDGRRRAASAHRHGLPTGSEP